MTRDVTLFSAIKGCFAGCKMMGLGCENHSWLTMVGGAAEPRLRDIRSTPSQPEHFVYRRAGLLRHQRAPRPSTRGSSWMAAAPARRSPYPAEAKEELESTVHEVVPNRLTQVCKQPLSGSALRRGKSRSVLPSNVIKSLACGRDRLVHAWLPTLRPSLALGARPTYLCR